ncbi:MAG TPA: hypothetical protein VG347_11430 [Verrucomicrobiae bacterium]|nr:hypothetical protein [Verrucomicrobiae bacterium]
MAVRRKVIGYAAVNNPLHILQTLDRHLTKPAEITLFGRAALALGYVNAPAEFAATRDVDAILPLSWLAAEDNNMDFWLAQQRTNIELQAEGLYLTHLFRELEVILTPDWLQARVRISLPFEKLVLFRPSTLDLILTKMVRGDQNDLEDIRFLLQQAALTTDALCKTFDRARIPDVPEIRGLFLATQSRVLAMIAER